MRKNILPQRFYALLLNEKFIKSGEGEINGVHRTWGDSYKITYVPFGDQTGKNIKTYKVAKEIEAQVNEALRNTGWGSIIRLVLDNNYITELELISDMSDYLPIE